MNKPFHFQILFRWRGVSVAIALLILMGLGGCGADEMDGTANAVENDAAAPDADEANAIHAAEAALEEHRVGDARDIYAQHLDTDPDHGMAAAGLAVTELLLLLEMDEVTKLLIENLGASSALDADDVIYGEGGYLYWASRGARWHDDGQYDGIQSILADDLPWSSDRLEAVPFFVDGLGEPMHKLMRQLVTVANALGGIDHNLQAAIDDPAFNRLYVPGQVFHDADLTLRLGRSELATLRSIIGMVRGAIYFVAAYEHDWSLEEAFGTWRFDVSLDDSSYVQGFGPVDYTVDYLDRHLFRDIANADRLAASRSAFRDSIDHARSAIRHGLEEPYSTTLAWDDVDGDDAYELDTLLDALGEALDGPSEIPFTEPGTVTLDLSPLFEDDGRTLDEETPWFLRQNGVNGAIDSDPSLSNADELWSLNDEAFETFWIDGVLEISGGDRDDLHVGVGPDGDDTSAFVDVLFGSYLDTVEDVYFSTR